MRICEVLYSYLLFFINFNFDNLHVMRKLSENVLLANDGQLLFYQYTWPVAMPVVYFDLKEYYVVAVDRFTIDVYIFH